MFVYHIVLPETWDKTKHQAVYETESLDSEGFIHCSYEDQVDGVLERYYSGVPEVVILKLDVSKLTSQLVSEPSTGGEIYPHIYGTINLDAVVNAKARTR